MGDKQLAAYPPATMRLFVAISLVNEPIPNQTTIPTFQHLLEKHNFGEQIFTTVTVHLKERGMTMKQGMITIHATLIAAPSSSKNKAGQ